MFSFGVTLSLLEKGKDRLELCLSRQSRIILTFFFILSCLVLFSGESSTGKVSVNLLLLILVIVTGHRLEEFRRIGKRFADFCGVPFQEK